MEQTWKLPPSCLVFIVPEGAGQISSAEKLSGVLLYMLNARVLTFQARCAQWGNGDMTWACG